MREMWWDGRRLAVAMVSLMAIATLARRAGAQQGADTTTPRGWLGVSLQQDTATGAKMPYPVLVAVDPGSPAQRAGLAAGDTIIAYDKKDARGEWRPNFRPYSVPGRKVVMRYRRNGVKETTVTVGRRTGLMNFQVTVTGKGDSGSQVRLVTSDSGMRLVISMMQHLAILTPSVVVGSVPVAGANVTRMNEGLASTLGVANEGVFVVDVTPDTPAEQAGLQSGDVIMTVNQMQCRDPSVIVKALYDSKGKKNRDVKLKVQRKGKPVQIVFR